MGSAQVKGTLLDTHVWVWLTLEKSSFFSQKAIKVLRQPTPKWISVISCWELLKLAEKQRIAFSIPVLTWIRRSLLEHQIRIADLSPEIAVESTQLKGFDQDPSDQILVASSRVLGMPIVTADRRILDFPNVDAIW